MEYDCMTILSSHRPNAADGDGKHRDMAYAAGFVIHNIPLMQSLDMFSWWTFTDIFEEHGLLAYPFSNAFGMQTIYGVAKPVYRAFEMLAGAGDAQVPVVVNSTSPTAITAFGTILSTSPSEIFHGLKLYVTNFQRHEIPTHQERATVIITHSPGARIPASAAVAYIDSAHANPRALWESLGSPMYPTAAQIALMKAASMVVEESVPVTVLSPTTVGIALDLEPYAVAFIHF
jgi:xylan 1,4-beta-xylosidase